MNLVATPQVLDHHYSAFLSYSEGMSIAHHFNAVVYRERSLHTGVEDTRWFLRELCWIALHPDQRPKTITEDNMGLNENHKCISM